MIIYQLGTVLKTKNTSSNTCKHRIQGLAFMPLPKIYPHCTMVAGKTSFNCSLETGMFVNLSWSYQNAVF